MGFQSTTSYAYVWRIPLCPRPCTKLDGQIGILGRIMGSRTSSRLKKVWFNITGYFEICKVIILTVQWSLTVSHHSIMSGCLVPIIIVFLSTLRKPFSKFLVNCTSLFMASTVTKSLLFRV